MVIKTEGTLVSQVKTEDSCSYSGSECDPEVKKGPALPRPRPLPVLRWKDTLVNQMDPAEKQRRRLHTALASGGWAGKRGAGCVP